MTLKLDVGSGPYPRPGYTTVDRYVPAAQVQADMWALPYADGTVDEIYSSHALEHVPTAKVAPTLTEWYRVLRPGGTLDLEVPDLAYCARFWLKHVGTDAELGFPLMTIFGQQTHPGEFHQTGFTKHSLRRYVERAGFQVQGDVETVWSHEQESLRVRAIKPS